MALFSLNPRQRFIACTLVEDVWHKDQLPIHELFEAKVHLESHPNFAAPNGPENVSNG